jgi:hypothetical protein
MIMFYRDTTEVMISACSANSTYITSYASSCDPPDFSSLSTTYASQGEGVGSWILFGSFEGGGVDLSAILYANGCALKRTKQKRFDFSDGTNQTVAMANACSQKLFFDSVNTTSVRRGVFRRGERVLRVLTIQATHQWSFHRLHYL